MKSFIFCLITSIFISAGTISAHAQEAAVSENPNIRFIIEGNREDIGKAPIVINNRTLVPLRALLVKLQVRDEDIVWNGGEQSVTIKKGQTEIYMRIGSDKAKVNGKEIILDVPPVIYNGSTYIPARFISQVLEKAVVWDSDTGSVLIQSQEQYLNIKQILLNCVNAVMNLKNAEVKSTSRIRYYGSLGESASRRFGIPQEFESTSGVKVTKDPLRLYMGTFFSTLAGNSGFWGLLSTIVNREIYIVESGIYVKLLGIWMRYELDWAQRAVREKEAYKYVYDISDIQGDTAYASFRIDESHPDDSLIVLRGNLALMPLLEKLNLTDVPIKLVGSGRQNFSIAIYLDRRTYLPVKREITFDIYYEENGNSFGLDGAENCEYFFNSDNIVIQVPSEAM